MKKMTVDEFKKKFPKAFDAWVKGLIEEHETELFVTKDGRPGYTFSGGYESGGQCIWQPKEKYFEEEYPEDE